MIAASGDGFTPPALNPGQYRTDSLNPHLRVAWPKRTGRDGGNATGRLSDLWLPTKNIASARELA